MDVIDKRREIYVSTDVETDGPIPGPHSMLALGSAAFNAAGDLIATYSANLVCLPDARPHPDTQAFWDRHPEAWAETRAEPRDPEQVMPEYAAWVENLPGHAVFVAYPAGFDFAWVFWYLHRFAGHSPFAHSAIDIRSYAMATLDVEFRDAGKRNWPPLWRGDGGQPRHVALDDAEEQGRQFCAMLRRDT